jgi:hypothetical protein
VFKKTIFVFICLAALLGATRSTVLAGPPWPAEVIIPTDDFCYSPWVAWDANGDPQIITLTDGSWQSSYQPHTGVWNAHCRFFIDFNDPTMATIDEMCAMAPDIFDCSQGVLIWRGLGCSASDTLYTEDTQMVVNPSGYYTVSCHFNP